MKHLKLSLYIVVGLFWSDLALAVLPASEKDITVYPGASLVKLKSEPETPNVRVNYSAEYTVSDTIDKVHAYYRKAQGPSPQVAMAVSLDNHLEPPPDRA